MQDTIASTLTYFNAFSIGKWNTYTDVEQISLHLFLKGRGRSNYASLMVAKQLC